LKGNYLPATGPAVRKDSPIKKIADLKGKRLTSDYPGSAIARKLIEAILVANNMSWVDVRRIPVTTTTAGFEALRDGRVDAAFALTGTTPIALEVHNAVGLTVLPFLDGFGPEDINKVPQSTINKITYRVPGARMTVVEPLGYIGYRSLGIEYPGLMVTSSHLDNDTVYVILETLWKDYQKLAPIHEWLKTWTPSGMFDPTPSLPYHPGAVQFFKDKGLWNANVDKIQQDLLKLAN
jgi:TRAP transporter TAXI family solute receptor